MPWITREVVAYNLFPFRYEVDGSVYFDTKAFGAAEGHDYAKLEPWSAGNEGLAEEGEGGILRPWTRPYISSHVMLSTGALSKKAQGKKNNSDFALWKGSKAGEPAWPSPWGEVCFTCLVAHA